MREQAWWGWALLALVLVLAAMLAVAREWEQRVCEVISEEE